MTKAHIFLGFPLDDACAAALEGLDPAFKKLYIQDDAAYLQEIVHNEQRYLGKIVMQTESLDALELLQDNIYSLLKKLVPDYPFRDEPLQLFPILDTIHGS